MKTPEITPEERAAFWRKRHDHLLAQFMADKARYEYESIARMLNARAEEAGYQFVAGQDGEPSFAPKAVSNGSEFMADPGANKNESDQRCANN